MLRATSQVKRQIEDLLASQQSLQAQKEKLQQELAINERAPRAAWHSAFQWDTDVARVMAGVFGLRAFRYAVNISGSKVACRYFWHSTDSKTAVLY
jgi:hypothetical protein